MPPSSFTFLMLTRRLGAVTPSFMRLIRSVPPASSWASSNDAPSNALFSHAYTFLDNPFTALDAGTKTQLCKVLDATGTTFLVIADEPTLREYFDVLLELRGDGDWQARACRGTECYSTRPDQPAAVGIPGLGRG